MEMLETVSTEEGFFYLACVHWISIQIVITVERLSICLLEI